MRKVGEKSFGSMAQAKKAPRELQLNKISVCCRVCEKEEKHSEMQIKTYHRRGFRCYECRLKESNASKKETNEAIIAIARRKGLKF